MFTIPKISIILGHIISDQGIGTDPKKRIKYLNGHTQLRMSDHLLERRPVTEDLLRITPRLHHP